MLWKEKEIHEDVHFRLPSLLANPPLLIPAAFAISTLCEPVSVGLWSLEMDNSKRQKTCGLSCHIRPAEMIPL